MEQFFSDWFKIDLHIHTDKSKETKEGDYKGVFSVETLKIKLKENGVRIFSLTDHNIINVDAYRDYYNSYNATEDPLLLLGVELDIQGSRKTYHSLLVFNHDNIASVEEISEKLEQKYSQKGITDKKSRTLEIADIVEIFKKEDFFFIPHAGDSHKNIVSGNRDNIPETQRMLILMQSALEKVTDAETIEHYNTGFDAMLTDEFQKRNDIAYINFSDNHCCEKYPKAHMGENDFSPYYIKGITSFESIRLAFIDPKSRIKSPEEYTQINNTKNVIEKISIKKSGEVDRTELLFSPHLNTIIGGRSSGKSLLMWLIGEKIDGNKPSKTYTNVNINDASIKTKDDDGLKEMISLGSSYLYLEQGDIIKYFEEKRLNDLALKAGKKEEYSQAKSQLKNLRSGLENARDSLFSAYTDAFDCNNGFVLSKKILDNVLDNRTYILKVEEKYIDDAKHLNEKNKIAELINSLNGLFSFSTIIFDEEEKQLLLSVIELLKKKQNEIDEKKKIIEKKNNFLKEVLKIVKEYNDSLNETARQKMADNEKIKDIGNEISGKFKKMYSLKLAAQQIKECKIKEKKSVQLQDDVALIVSVESDIIVENQILDGLNGANYEISLFKNFLCLLDRNNSDCTIKHYRDCSPLNFEKKINSMLDPVFKDIDNPIDYLEYNDGSDSRGKSPGFNSEQYLNIVLSNPQTNVVFIDQPEDNLGNQFITSDLVEQLRKIKFEKQIFLVTHNPSIVIYGDAECIILAENKQNNISYKQLLIEDKEAQKKICDVLDGGEYIFYNRAQKYNIHKIKH